jgi:CSLREA domain-containing protein
MYHQIKPTETFRERQLVLLREADDRRLAQRRAGGVLKARSGMAALGLLAALVVVAGLLLAAKPSHAQTNFTVNSELDTPDANLGDGSCSTDRLIGQSPECTLRAALEEVNFASGSISTINFDIPGSGVKTISPSTSLPGITEQVTIDGYSQPGARANTLAKGTNAVLKLELNGSNVGLAGSGLVIRNAQNCVIRGLVINRFKGGDGININGVSAKDNRIEGNFIGTDPSGTVDLGNGEDGVAIVEASANVVGGTTPDKRNLISGNLEPGVLIGAGSANNKVEGNLIGTQKDGLTPLGNDASGVFINGSANNIVEGSTPASANTIAFNGKDGVALLGGTGNRILSNSIFSNTQEGIDLTLDGVTPNDGDDPATVQPDADKDTGANNLQNFPVLSSARTSKKGTSIKGTLNSTPDETFLVQFFSNPSNTDEGHKFIGKKSVSTDPMSGDASFTFKTRKKVGRGANITATATNEFSGDTSEFSTAKKVVRKR